MSYVQKHCRASVRMNFWLCFWSPFVTFNEGGKQSCIQSHWAKRSWAFSTNATRARHRCNSHDQNIAAKPKAIQDEILPSWPSLAMEKEYVVRTILLGNCGSYGCDRSKTTCQSSDPLQLDVDIEGKHLSVVAKWYVAADWRVQGLRH